MDLGRDTGPTLNDASTMKLARLVGTLVLGATVSLAPLPGFTAEPQVTTVLEGLVNPCGIAVQPETGRVFVSESGAGRIIQVDAAGKAQDVVVGSPTELYGPGPKYTIGPLGLAFFDKNTLVVGDGGYPDGQEFLRVFSLPADGKTLDYATGAQQQAGPLAASDTAKPEGNFYGVAVNKTVVFVACNGDDAEGWIARAPIDGTKFGKLERFIATKRAVQVAAPAAIAIGPRGELVVGQLGELNRPGDSQLTFYSSSTGKKLLNLETGLHDITALAYHPKTGLLYALDFAWSRPADGGLYRIDRSTQAGDSPVKVTKIAALERPTALAFTPDGAAYVATMGSPPDGETAAPTGRLLKIVLP
jgi:DNA-binding beta-propeller fold protein YncE